LFRCLVHPADHPLAVSSLTSINETNEINETNPGLTIHIHWSGTGFGAGTGLEGSSRVAGNRTRKRVSIAPGAFGEAFLIKSKLL
jgi:hypothetical protein